jgi:hypothetical protein
MTQRVTDRIEGKDGGHGRMQNTACEQIDGLADQRITLRMRHA